VILFSPSGTNSIHFLVLSPLASIQRNTNGPHVSRVATMGTSCIWTFTRRRCSLAATAPCGSAPPRWTSTTDCGSAKWRPVTSPPRMPSPASRCDLSYVVSASNRLKGSAHANCPLIRRESSRPNCQGHSLSVCSGAAAAEARVRGGTRAARTQHHRRRRRPGDGQVRLALRQSAGHSQMVFG